MPRRGSPKKFRLKSGVGRRTTHPLHSLWLAPWRGYGSSFSGLESKLLRLGFEICRLGSRVLGLGFEVSGLQAAPRCAQVWDFGAKPLGLRVSKQPKLQIAVKVAVRVVASGAALCGARMGCLVLMLGLAVS